MNATMETVETAAMQLLSEERAELIERLIDTVVPPPPLRAAWEAEIARRVAEKDERLVEGIPVEQVFARTHAMIEARDLGVEERAGGDLVPRPVRLVRDTGTPPGQSRRALPAFQIAEVEQVVMPSREQRNAQPS